MPIQSYFGSTNPNSSPGTSGLLTYSNFNALNSPYLNSTNLVNTVSAVASSCVNCQTLTASSAVNTVNVVASSCGSIPILNSTNTITGVTIAGETVSSTSATFGSVTATSATFGKLTSSSGNFADINTTNSIFLYGNLKQTENWTAQVIVGTCATPASDNIPRSGYYYLSSSSGDINRYLLQSPLRGSRVTLEFNCGLTTANIAYVWVCSTDGVNATIGAATSGQIGIASCGVNPHITLLGVSTGRWIIESMSTYGENGGTLSLVSSCYS